MPRLLSFFFFNGVHPILKYKKKKCGTLFVMANDTSSKNQENKKIEF
jgi:hypothetical protein